MPRSPPYRKKLSQDNKENAINWKLLSLLNKQLLLFNNKLNDTEQPKSTTEISPLAVTDTVFVNGKSRKRSLSLNDDEYLGRSPVKRFYQDKSDLRKGLLQKKSLVSQLRTDLPGSPNELISTRHPLLRENNDCSHRLTTEAFMELSNNRKDSGLNSWRLNMCQLQPANLHDPKLKNYYFLWNPLIDTEMQKSIAGFYNRSSPFPSSPSELSMDTSCLSVSNISKPDTDDSTQQQNLSGTKRPQSEKKAEIDDNADENPPKKRTLTDRIMRETDLKNYLQCRRRLKKKGLSFGTLKSNTDNANRHECFSKNDCLSQLTKAVPADEYKYENCYYYSLAKSIESKLMNEHEISSDSGDESQKENIPEKPASIWKEGDVSGAGASCVYEHSTFEPWIEDLLNDFDNLLGDSPSKIAGKRTGSNASSIKGSQPLKAASAADRLGAPSRRKKRCFDRTKTSSDKLLADTGQKSEPFARRMTSSPDMSRRYLHAKSTPWTYEGCLQFLSDATEKSAISQTKLETAAVPPAIKEILTAENEGEEISSISSADPSPRKSGNESDISLCSTGSEHEHKKKPIQTSIELSPIKSEDSMPREGASASAMPSELPSRSYSKKTDNSGSAFHMRSLSQCLDEHITQEPFDTQPPEIQSAPNERRESHTSRAENDDENFFTQVRSRPEPPRCDLFQQGPSIVRFTSTPDPISPRKMRRPKPIRPVPASYSQYGRMPMRHRSTNIFGEFPRSNAFSRRARSFGIQDAEPFQMSALSRCLSEEIDSSGSNRRADESDKTTVPTNPRREFRDFEDADL